MIGIEPGVWVVAADAAAREHAGETPYLCVAVVRSEKRYCGACAMLTDGLVLKGLQGPCFDTWCVHHWRPIYRGGVARALEQAIGWPLTARKRALAR